MSNLMSVKEICEKLWDLERRNKLVEVEIQGVYIWEVIRFSVFLNITNEYCKYGDAHTTIDSNKNKIKALPRLLVNSIFKSPFSGNYEVDYLIYDHPRKVNFQSRYIDIYTQYFIVEHTDAKFDILEAPYLLKHFTSNTPTNRRYLDHEILRYFFVKKRLHVKFSEEEARIISEIEYEINKIFKLLNINLKNLIEKKLKDFLHGYYYHKKLFQKRKPKSIYVVVSYGNIPIIAAAKTLGIEVVEFQHGVITNYHFAYNFGNSNAKLRYFPDKILTFGEYWSKAAKFPDQTTIEIYGFPYLNNQINKYRNIKKKKKQILFISQGTIGRELSKLAKKLVESLPEYQFIYKLHPGEYDRWIQEYPGLVSAMEFGNLQIIDNSEINIYQLFAESEFQIGVYSTAIFEGLTLKCKTILINLPGIEYMNDLIDKQLVKVANDEKDIINAINKHEVKAFSRDYFFKETINISGRG